MQKQQQLRTRLLSWATMAALAGSLFLGVRADPAQAAVNVVVNGSPVHFDQPPVERAGRVFVPLRGVFEQLGATVVFSDGVINATGNGRTIQLHIGSTQALVDGQPAYLDVPPFIVGSRTLVPLRFISQALGASVGYDNNTQIVTVTMASAQAPVVRAPAPTTTPFNTVDLIDRSPGAAASVPSRHPAISAHFSQPVDPNSVKIALDGRDVTTGAYVGPNEFQFTPSYDLPSARHEVHISGLSAKGVAFARGWSFNSGTSEVRNFISSVAPVKGSQVGSDFTISGTTLPSSHLKIVAEGTANVAGIFRVGTGTFVGETIADQNGHFAQQVQLATPGGSEIGVRIISTQPTSKASASVDLTYVVAP
ncbi:copper amine oxidase N-terminal domain-containing protein [bacterium]|nr:MAG: copper amine oxidase N-terminal domain-containing protein [bacterium]